MAATPNELLEGGLQNERTSLAWIRTALSMAGAGAFLAKQSGNFAFAVVVLVAVGAVGTWVLVRSGRHQRERYEQLIGTGTIGVLPEIAVTTAVAVALAVAGLVVLLT